MERLAGSAENIANVYFIETKQPTPHNENRPLRSICLGSGPNLERRLRINRGFVERQRGVTFLHRAAPSRSQQHLPSSQPAASLTVFASANTHRFYSLELLQGKDSRMHLRTARVGARPAHKQGCQQ